jgi:acyl-CoA carboxylase epsilon subunit-like protein
MTNVATTTLRTSEAPANTAGARTVPVRTGGPLRVVRGNPTEEELAALVVVLAAMGARAQKPPHSPAQRALPAMRRPYGRHRSPVSWRGRQT